MYLRNHPELQELLTDFMCAALQAKPDDILQFAVRYFVKPSKSEARSRRSTATPN